METLPSQKKLTHSVTLKLIVIAVITLVMLIPGCMVQFLVQERERTHDKAVRQINDQWCDMQEISGPVLVVPYSLEFGMEQEVQKNKQVLLTSDLFNITPEELDIRTTLSPEERHLGIYKTIVYESATSVSGRLLPAAPADKADKMHWDKAYLKFSGLDLRGISEDVLFEVNGKKCEVLTTEETGVLKIPVGGIVPGRELSFRCEIALRGSRGIYFYPLGHTTHVSASGAWQAPGFEGQYLPEYTLSKEGFEAQWKVLNFGRNFPDTWSGDTPKSVRDTRFGVKLVDTVDVYRQNMRSAKYALLFIVLTFVVFLFVEIRSRKRIHPVQYLLVGTALVLFYSLLLSISERLGFAWAYSISSAATVGLITLFASAIFRSARYTTILAAILTGLYVLLFVILQLEDTALLVGSIGLFLILAVIMYFSSKIDWYGEQPTMRKHG